MFKVVLGLVTARLVLQRCVFITQHPFRLVSDVEKRVLSICRLSLKYIASRVQKIPSSHGSSIHDPLDTCRARSDLFVRFASYISLGLATLKESCI